MPEVAAPDTRARLLAAAAQCYAAGGSRGATTRAIAAAAGVHEGSIFRLFGGKEALLAEAKAVLVAGLAAEPLPIKPGDPLVELTQWARESVARMSRVRDLLRQDFAEAAHGPDTHSAGRLFVQMGEQVARYLRALDGVAVPSARLDATVAMFVGALSTEAMVGGPMRGGDWLPDEMRLREYVAATLAAVGVPARGTSGGAS